MLVALYIISAVAGIMSAVFEHQRKLKQQLIFAIIAIISCIAFCAPIVNDIFINSVLNFKLIWAALSLLALQFALLRNDIENIVNYQIAMCLMAIALNSFCYIFFVSYADHIVSCTTEHVTTEIVPIVTTIDGTASGRSIYGEGFVICSINDMFSNDHTYQYYYRTAEGNILSKDVDYKDAQIEYIDNSVSPYVEIISTQNCFGYTRLSKKHKITSSSDFYILYIPEGSIKQVADAD